MKRFTAITDYIAPRKGGKIMSAITLISGCISFTAMVISIINLICVIRLLKK